MSKLKYKRVMLKISGEVLSDKSGQGIDFGAVDELIAKVKDLQAVGCEVAILNGGGNFWRYRDNAKSYIERQDSDTIGMLSTVMNGMVIYNALKKSGVVPRIMSGVAYDVVERFDSKFARGHLRKGRVVTLRVGGLMILKAMTSSILALTKNGLAQKYSPILF